MARRVFDSTNPTGFALNKETKKLSVTPGICAGMTAVWCLKMNIGLPVENTGPGYQESLHLQYSYDDTATSPRGLLTKFLPIARLTYGENVFKGNGRQTAAGVIQTGGDCTFFWGYPGHAIGAGKRAGKYYVFDPDRGLDELDDVGGFRNHLEGTYPEKMKVDGWFAIEVKADPKQMDLIRPPQR